MDKYFIKKGFNIVHCGICNLMAVENVPDDLSAYYREGYFTGDTTLDGYMDYDADKEVSKKTYINFLDIIGKYLENKVDPSMFEVGCATGFFLDLAKKKGWQSMGIDISAYAVQKSREKGLEASVGVLENHVTEKKFDVLVMQDVIEHVKNPVLDIKKCWNLLVENGLLVLTTPDAGSLWARIWGRHWHAFVPPQHLFYFSVKNLSSVLEKNGFKVEYCAHHGKWFSIPYIIRLLYSWTGIYFFSKLAKWSSTSFLKNIALPINVGDTIFLIARKK